ncbi:MAG: response regulator transcription factor [Bacteroidetes bacterium]|nr:response regulator transcription factor [Bacteroidota bacterium]
MINAIIIEDEKKSASALEELLKRNCPEVSLLGKAGSVKEGYDLFYKTKPDLIFLDVMLGDGSGFDVLEKLSDLKFEVIFTTAHEKFAIKAIKYSALDYLLKPIDAEELKIAVGKIAGRNQKFSNEENLRSLLENVKQKEDQFSKITFPSGHAYEIVSIKDIIRCEANDNYTNVFLSNGKKLLVSGTLKQYEDLLPEKDFVRVHHSNLINMAHMVRFMKEDGGYAEMSDGSKVEVSRRKRDDLLQRLK